MDKEDTNLIFPAERIPALPYAYSPENEMQEALISQIANYCGYELQNEETNPDGIKKEDFWRQIWLAIRYLSLLTCWTDNIRDTFFTQTRRQSFTTTDKCGCRNQCSCKDDTIVIPLAYAPRPEQPWVSATMTVVADGIPTVTKIPAEYLHSHTDNSTDLLYIVRKDFDHTLYRYDRCCYSHRKITIILEYNAGYDTLPEGLLAAICPILSKIDSAKIGLNDCAAAMTQVVGLLKRKKVGNTEYEWSDNDSSTQKTQTLFTDVFDIALLSEIEAISRCDQAEGVEEIGDVV